jgi:hypothetical protein
VILAVLGVITGAVAYLVRQNQALAEQNRLLTRRAVDPRPGLYVPALDVQTLDGMNVALGEPGRRQLLFFFNHTCVYCRASVPAWKALSVRLGGDPGIAVYGVALDSTDAVAAYTAEHGIGFPVIARPDPRLAGLYRVSAVPLVLVVDDGRMTYARLGTLESPEAIDSVLAAVRARRSVTTAEGP